MNQNRISVYARLGLALALVLALGILAGCGKSSDSNSASTTSAFTAKHALNIAMSTLSTAAPNGKLLVGQSAAPLTATSTPAWDFLIGNPKNDTIYAVEVVNGQGRFQEYGKADLSDAEWAAVPAPSAWKIDSDAAHTKAVAVNPAGKDAAYIMGFLTYIPPSANDKTAKPMKWIVSFDPSKQGSAPTSTVLVDMVTGDAAFAK